MTSSGINKLTMLGGDWQERVWKNRILYRGFYRGFAEAVFVVMES